MLLLKIKNLCTKKSIVERLFKSLSKNEGKERAALPQTRTLKLSRSPPPSLWGLLRKYPLVSDGKLIETKANKYVSYTYAPNTYLNWIKLDVI